MSEQCPRCGRSFDTIWPPYHPNETCVENQLADAKARIAELEAIGKQANINFRFVLLVVEHIADTHDVSAGTWQDRVNAVMDLATGRVKGPLAKLYDEAKARIAELEAKLPKTADGVSVVQGDKVWVAYPNIKQVTIDIRGQAYECVDPDTDSWSETESYCLRMCYSTLEAANAAKEKPEDYVWHDVEELLGHAQIDETPKEKS